jgi:hypothetical protein
LGEFHDEILPRRASSGLGADIYLAGSSRAGKCLNAG